MRFGLIGEKIYLDLRLDVDLFLCLVIVRK